MAEPETDRTPVAGCLARLFWMAGGLLALIFLSFSIFKHHAFSIRDLAFLLIVLCLVLIRYVDIRYLHGETAEGEPATMSHWRRYTIGLLSGSLGVWLVLHVLSRFIH
jgi:hypothetical protein